MGTEYTTTYEKMCLACNQLMSAEFSHCPQDGTQLVGASEVTDEDQIGELAKRYKIQERWDKYNVTTYKLVAKDDSQRRVIAKVFRKTTRQDRERERFERLIRQLGALEHPRIPKLLDIGAVREGIPYILVEYKEGVSLRAYVRDMDKRQSIGGACKILLGACEALQHAHSCGVFHPDLTAGDIIVDDSSGDVSIIDFGKGRPLLHNENREEQYTEKGDLFGSAAVMAPEIMQNKNEPDAFSNVYSLGCIIYFALTGQDPFRAKNWIAVLNKHMNEPVPSAITMAQTEQEIAINEVIFKAMRKHKFERFDSVKELSLALQSVMALSPNS